MKAKFTSVLFALLLGILSTNAQNLLTNPGFEDGGVGTDQTVSGWNTNASTASETYLEILSGNEGYNSDKALMVIATLPVFIRQPITISSGGEYTFSFRYKFLESVNANANISITAPAASELSLTTIKALLPDTYIDADAGWQHVTYTTKELNSGSFNIVMMFIGCIAVVDDFSLTVKSSSTAVTGVTLDKTTASLTVGNTEQLTATVAPADATNKNLSWASNNIDVATVDANGLVTALAAGSSDIIVTTEDGNLTATCALTVSAAQTDNLLSNPGFEDGESEVWLINEDFTSENTVVDIDESDAHSGEYSKLIAVEAGEALIYQLTELSVHDPSKAYTLTFWYKLVEGSASIYGRVGLHRESDGRTSSTYSSESTYYLTGDIIGQWKQGIIEYPASENTRNQALGVSFYIQNNQDVSNSAVILIDDVSLTVKSTSTAVTGVTLNKTTASLTVGNTEQLTATVAPEDASNKNISWASTNTAVATVDANGLVTAVAAGTANITVTTTDGSKTATCAVTVNKTAQTISGLVDMTKNAGDATFSLSATASSSLAVTYTSSNTSVATISGSTVNIIGAGTTTITASQAGNESYAAAPDVTATLTVNKVAQTITGLSDMTKTTGDADFDLVATASSSLAVIYASSNTAVATISGSAVTIVGAGTTTITASQAGNNTYAAAPDVTVTLTVNKVAQTITGLSDMTKTAGDADFDLAATASSSLAVTYASSNTAVATISGSTVTIVGAGTTTITASQAGNDTYNAATDVTATLTVNEAAKLDQTISGLSDMTKTTGDTDFDLAATASSSLAVTYASSNAEVATISGSTVTIVGAGTTTITASQAGNDTYNAATDVTVTLTVNAADKLNQTISGLSDMTKTTGDTDFDLAATASSSLAVTYASSNAEVATISGSTVTIVGAGTTTITASQAGNDTYNAATDVTATLTVKFPTGINEVRTQLPVRIQNGNIIVSAEPGSTVEVYNAMGIQLNSQVANSSETIFSNLPKGRVFIVRCGNAVAKVIL